MIDETIDFIPAGRNQANKPLVPTLGIVWHPDVSRIGDLSPLLFSNSKTVELSRNSPQFYSASGGAGTGLLDLYVSRKPIKITRVNEHQFEITAPQSGMQIWVNGHPLLEPTIFSLGELGRDIIISISDQVILSLFLRPLKRCTEASEHGLVGVSAQIDDMWQMIKLAALCDDPVLIKGDTGTGKELVAHAIHMLSARCDRPIFNVNMATVTDGLAAADLFGSIRGAFTGALKDRMGLFEQANESSLFLDEIGNTPDTVQPMLLRTLETGEIRRVGEARTRRSLARVIAATDHALDRASFNQPLLRRLEALQIDTVKLSERLVDVGLLVLHFLEKLPNKTIRTQALPGTLIHKMILHDWQGNVRELRNMVRQISLGRTPAFSGRACNLDPSVQPKQRKVYRPVEAVGETEMLDALDANEWCIKSTAETLKISRTALYNLIDKSTHVRKADELSDREIKAVLETTMGDVGMLAKKLRVSRTALKNRIKRLSLQ